MTKPEILSLGEFKKLRGQQKRPLLVYLAENQFKKLLSGSKFRKGKLKPGGVTIALISLESGGFLQISAPGGKGPFIGTNGALLAKPCPPEETPCAAVPKGGIIVCEGSCGTGSSCGLAFAPSTVALFRTATGITVPVPKPPKGGCGCS
jgi:hypothetical protein